MKGGEITAAIKVASARRAQDAGAEARRALWKLVESADPIPKRQSAKYYEWLADEIRYDTHFRWANGSFRNPGVWASLGRMHPSHVAGFAPALRAVLEKPGNLPDRPVLYFLCEYHPYEYLDGLVAEPTEAKAGALIARFRAVSILCMAPKAATAAYRKKLAALVKDPVVMAAAHHLVNDLVDTLSYWDLEFVSGLLGLLRVEDSEDSRAAIEKALAFLKTETRDERNVLSLSDAKATLASYG